MLEGSGIDVRMMCGVAQPVPPPCAQLSIALSHTCAPHPSCCLPFTVSSVMCPHRRESVLVLSLRCHCPAVRVHNHTVLPSSHNSSYVYTNDSAFTNISATVGENQTLFALTEMYRGHQTALLCFPVCDFILSSEIISLGHVAFQPPVLRQIWV